MPSWARLATDAARRVGAARASLDAERRSLETFRPAAYLAAERERVGLLLDRATRAVRSRSAADRAALAAPAGRLPGLVRARIEEARAGLTRSGAALAALDPYATLERGYAIVRAPDGAIVTDAATQHVGDRLAVTLARGRVGRLRGRRARLAA